MQRVNRRLLTILLPLATASLVAGCTTFSDGNAVARVGDIELSEDDLDQLLTDQQATDEQRQDLNVVRDVISAWIESTAVETGQFSSEQLAAIPDDELLALYGQGLTASGVACVRLIVAPSTADGDDAVARLESGEDFSTVFDAVNTDADLATVGGEAGCFDATQFASMPELTPEIEALFALNANDPYASAATVSPDGSEDAALVLVFRDADDLPEADLTQIVQVIREQKGVGIVVGDIDIHVDSRYGTFDLDSARVVPLG